MSEIFDIERLMSIEDEETWRLTYEEEIAKLDQSFQDLARIQYEEMIAPTGSGVEEELTLQHFQLFSSPLWKVFIEEWEQKETDKEWKRRLEVLKGKAMEVIVESHPEIVKCKADIQSILMKQSFQSHGESYPFPSVQVQLMNQANRALREDLFLQMNHFAKQVTSAFRKLVKARNGRAQQLGFDHYYHYVFEGIMGLHFPSYKEQVKRMLDGLSKSSSAREQRFQEKFQWNQTQYYDILYAALHYFEIPKEPFSSGKLIEALQFTCQQWGLDPCSLPIKMELRDIPFGGLMMAISPDDIRLVVKKRDGHSGFAVGLHELGHALYEYYSSHQKPDLFRFKSLIGHEAMAELFMGIASQREWLIDCLGLEEALIHQIQGAEKLFSYTLTKLYYYQSLLEQSIYENPDQDFQQRANQLFEEVFGMKGMAMNPAVDMMFCLYPVYTHTYLYADGIREMIRANVDPRGLYKNQELWEKIRIHFMVPSESLPWEEKVKTLCGQEFSFTAFGEYLSQP
ncbi:hypothetical protein [Ammoniphilus sp. YIM 78166]|uniref:hypothetical protein n=1 Tax=Ammoniphilus sp. YIM 78166 TaxID=1644106 RepID=UPI00106F3921|nr:hypothetical protein [Ammoniphilus sp. YIM 78166]